jgi:hypothetical protein
VTDTSVQEDALADSAPMEAIVIAMTAKAFTPLR